MSLIVWSATLDGWRGEQAHSLQFWWEDVVPVVATTGSCVSRQNSLRDHALGSEKLSTVTSFAAPVVDLPSESTPPARIEANAVALSDQAKPKRQKISERRAVTALFLLLVMV